MKMRKKLKGARILYNRFKRNKATLYSTSKNDTARQQYITFPLYPSIPLILVHNEQEKLKVTVHSMVVYQQTSE